MRCQHTAEFLEIGPFLESSAPPEKVLRLNGQQVWKVRKQPVDFTRDSTDADWALVRAPSELIRIPLIPYRTNSMDPAEFGLSNIDMASRLFMDFPNAIRIHIIYGRPVEDLRPETEAFRYWVGIAVQLH